MTSPIPGVIYPSPRTWSAGDLVTTPRLRADMYDLCAIFVQARPQLVAAVPLGAGQTISSAATVTLVDIAGAQLNTWQVPVVTSPLSTTYAIPLAGWYLCEGGVAQGGGGGTEVQTTFGQGIQAVQSGVGLNSMGAMMPNIATTGFPVAGMGADLFQFNVGDTCALFAYFTPTFGDTNVITSSFFQLEWAAMPTTNLAGAVGTVVASPQLAAPWPPGPGTYITSSGGIAAGATSVLVKSAQGIVVNGTIGLDFTGLQRFQPVAEQVTVTSVAGTTIGISATAFAHSQGAPVAVPISAAWMNQQDRDVVNFLAYPPLFRAQPQSAQAIGSASVPGGVQITGFSSTVDNFSGGSSTGYTVQVGGVYYVYGQVFFAGSTATTAYSAGIAVGSGTIQWGATFRSATSSAAQQMCATVRRQVRLAAGQVVTLWGSQSSGSSMNTVVAASPVRSSRLILVWRAF